MSQDELDRLTGPLAHDEILQAKDLVNSFQVETESEEWSLFVDFNGVLAWRKPVPGKNFYMYKSVSVLDLDVHRFFECYSDVEYRAHWDTSAETIQIIGEHEMNEIVHWHVKLPWPLAPRDYVYYRRVGAFPEEGVYVICARSAPLGHHKDEKSGVVRVHEFVSTTVIQRVDDQRIKVICVYFDDPRGSIPSAIVNFAAKQAFPKMMSQFTEAYDRYEEYKKSKK
eukprot:c14488_g1_i2.p2 GENE.c14488_g1_i2~~c14488_g1_i2.p2  ORF type:complete len:241 (+),score=52.64 c14488_g1_i2:49-723(+)